MSQCTVSSDNSEYYWDKAVSFCLLRTALLKHLAFPRSNKQTNYYYHNTRNGETIQFSLRLNVRHVTVFVCDALKLNALAFWRRNNFFF